jgi:hypothetical protein
MKIANKKLWIYLIPVNTTLFPAIGCKKLWENNEAFIM